MMVERIKSQESLVVAIDSVNSMNFLNQRE